MSGAAADLDLDACLSVALGAAREAGEVIVAAFNEAKRVEVKGSSLADLVTDTDKKCEELIGRRLTEAFPDGFGFIGEEQTAAAAQGGAGPVLGAGPTWMVDPLDVRDTFARESVPSSSGGRRRRSRAAD